jgi:signal transduction histidine kinase
MNNRRFRWGIREKLTLLFFVVTLLAVSVNFLIVVPRLELRLRNDRVKAMDETAMRLDDNVQRLFRDYDPNLVAPAPVGGIWSNNLGASSVSAGDKVAILRHVTQQGPLGPQDYFLVVWDPSGETPMDGRTLIEDPIAAEAVRAGQKVRGISSDDDGLHAEVAVPLEATDGSRPGVAIYSTSLAGVTATVRQIARRQLFSGVIALSIALIAGLLASSYMARRLRRLEHAAREVASGNFTEPIVVDSEDEIGAVAAAFNTMQDRLGQADRARKAFIANASHELRTPIFSLGGYVELMRDEELDDETQREFLDQMHTQIVRMTKLSTDLLDLSKIDTGSLAINPHQVDLTGLVKSVRREFEPQLTQHQSSIEIVAPEVTEAICDPDRVAQIVRILIDNALNHTPNGTAIRVTLDNKSSGTTVIVADDGPGISAEHAPRIFDRFHTGSKSGGTGLGLAIARDLATAMNGSLDIWPSEKGAAFRLHLPAGVQFRDPNLSSQG